MAASPPNPETPSPGGVRLRFGRKQRLTKARDYEAVHKARTRKVSGSLAVSGVPNGLEYSRLGLAIGRRVGPAVVRSKIKRLIREAFRLEQRALPRGLDFVVTVRSAADASLVAYREALIDAAIDLQTEWDRRKRRGAREDPR